MAQGADTIIGHQRGSVWNTPVSVNVANAGLLLNDWPIGNGLGPLVYSESLTGSGGRSNAIRGLNKLTGDVTTELRYSGLEHLLAMIMGEGGAPVTTTGVSTHTFDLSSNIDGLFDTIVVQKQTPGTAAIRPWQYNSAKYGGMTITMTADGLAMMTVPLIASQCITLTGHLAGNENLTAVTYRTKTLNVFGTHIKVRANDAAGLALTDADRIYPSQLTLTFNRNLDSSYVMDGTGVQPEPYYTTFYDATLSFVFPVYGSGNLQMNNKFLTAAFSEIPQKLDIVMTSPQLIPGSTPPTNYSIKIEAGFVIVGDVQMPVNDSGVIPQNVEMAMLAPPGAVTGMAGLTTHFRMILAGAFTTDPLLNP